MTAQFLIRFSSIWTCWAIVAVCGCGSTNQPSDQQASPIEEDVPQQAELLQQGPPGGVVRFATFNVALSRSSPGDLVIELQSGSEQASKIAAIIQIVRPQVLLLNELDYDGQQESLAVFCDDYLAVDQRNGGLLTQAIEYPYRFTSGVNTGEPSGIDLNADGEIDETDALGFGMFPGQYGMAVLSQFPISADEIRTFRQFRWQDMPAAKWPSYEDGRPYYSEAATDVVRLSSKSHWDVPIELDGETIRFLVCHPTPPVFDGPEDRNGCRNHDEIRLLADYVAGGDQSSYIVDDQGTTGGIAEGAAFVIAGDLNADPADGASRDNAAAQLLEHPRIQAIAPTSAGGVEMAERQGGKNSEHQGDPAHDTSDFGDRDVGNLRVDYVLPSKALVVVGSGVYWPTSEQPAYGLVTASDHRLVWVDLKRGNGAASD